MNRIGKAALLATALIISGYAQNYQPAVEMSSLMNIRIYAHNGGFMVEKLTCVFPPAEGAAMSFEVLNGAGTEIASLPLRIQKWGQFPVFDGLVPGSGQSGVIQVGQEGEFEFQVTINGAVATRFPFKMTKTSSGDPFNPSDSYTRDGAWASLAFFSAAQDRPDDALVFNYWTNLRETGQGKSLPKCSIHIMRGGQEIAASKPVVTSSTNWQMRSQRLLRDRYNFTLAELCGTDGDVEIVMKADDKLVKSYQGTVSGGKLQPLAENDLNHEPHHAFISPRIIDTSEGTGSRYKMLEAYWVRKK